MGPLLSDIELRRVMESDPSVALGPKGLNASAGLYTGGMNDAGGLESERLCPCRVCCARPGNLGPKPGEGESVGGWGETERPGVGDVPCCCSLLSLKRSSWGSAGDEICKMKRTRDEKKGGWIASEEWMWVQRGYHAPTLHAHEC